MLKNLRKCWIVLVAPLWLAACKPGVPSDYIQPDDLEDLLYDFHIAQSMAEMSRDSLDYKRYSYVQAVFEKHGVTEADFDSTMIWYSAHASYLNTIYKNLKERYTSNVSALGAATGETDIFANLDAQGDTANIWQDRNFRVLKPKLLEDRMLFSFEADSTFRKGDALLWRFEASFLTKGRQTNEAHAGFYVTYDNDSTVGLTRRLYDHTQTELRIDGDTAHAIRKVGGFIYFKSLEKETEPRLMFVHDIMLVRMHPEVLAPDTVADVAVTDSLDSLRVDSLRTDSLPVVPSTHRLSPTELRDSRDVERTINVVKEKPYRVGRPARNNKRR